MHWKKSLLVIHKILRQFVNTLTVDDKHYLLNRDNWTQPIQIQLSQKQKMSSNVPISMTPPFQNLLITLNVVPLQKISLSDLVIHKILIVFVSTLRVNDKHYLLNRDSLAQRIQMQLYQKQKNISEFFSCIPKIYLKF